MRDQDVDLACMAEEGEELRPLRLRYGVTALEATRREPLEVALGQEEADVAATGGDGTWDDVDPDVPAVVRSRGGSVPEDVDEEQVAPAAEQDAMHCFWLGVEG